MEFQRDSVVALYLAGKPQVAIVRVLQCINVNKSFVFRLMEVDEKSSNISRNGTQSKEAT